VIRPYVVGVTGGIGAGKSTVCNQFVERHGVPLIDADVVAREVVEPGQPALAAIVAAFTPAILDQQGRLDRAKLRSVVFADPQQRRLLENILHPEIRQAIRTKVAAIGAAYCLLAIPLLAEGGKHESIDRVLVVDCPEELQINRVRLRDHLTESEVMAIMRTQASRAARLRVADDVIVNAGDNAALARRVDELHDMYQQLAAPTVGRHPSDDC